MMPCGPFYFTGSVIWGEHGLYHISKPTDIDIKGYLHFTLLSRITVSAI